MDDSIAKSDRVGQRTPTTTADGGGDQNTSQTRRHSTQRQQSLPRARRRASVALQLVGRSQGTQTTEIRLAFIWL